MQKRLQSNTGLHAIKASTPFEPLVTCGALNYNPSKSYQQAGQIKVIVAPTRCKPASKFRVSAQKAPLPSSPTNNRYKNQTLIKVYPPDSLNSASKLLKTTRQNPLQQSLRFKRVSAQKAPLPLLKKFICHTP